MHMNSLIKNIIFLLFLSGFFIFSSPQIFKGFSSTETAKEDSLFLRTDPQDAAVYRNDSLIGYTPLHLSQNYKNLELKKPGYETRVISSDELKEDHSFLLNYVGEVKEKSFFKKDLFKYLIAGIVVLGGTTAYYKLKADKKFDAYKITGEQELLDQTHKYDLISGITFTALQINFGVMIYLFLSD